jgi:hypothetical protein
MSWRRRKKKAVTYEPSPAMPQSGLPERNESSRPAVNLTTKLRLAADFGVVFKRVADLIRNELATAGKVRTMVCFVYAGDRKEDGSTSPTIKTVFLSWKTEFQKELIRKRIRDKAVLEKASAVLVVADAEMGPANAQPNGSSQRKGTILISGTSPSADFSASLTYVVQGETDTVSLDEMQWFDEPAYNFFLDGIHTK